jgi:hypothetical protein
MSMSVRTRQSTWSTDAPEAAQPCLLGIRCPLYIRRFVLGVRTDKKNARWPLRSVLPLVSATPLAVGFSTTRLGLVAALIASCVRSFGDGRYACRTQPKPEQLRADLSKLLWRRTVVLSFTVSRSRLAHRCLGDWSSVSSSAKSGLLINPRGRRQLSRGRRRRHLIRGQEISSRSPSLPPSFFDYHN